MSRQPLTEFYNSVGEHYDEEDAVYATLRGRLRRAFVLQWLSQQRGRLLEIGCNRGMYLAAYNGGERYGADLSLTVLKKARREPKICYVAADAERMQCFRGGSFDVVLCSEVIEHCFRPNRVMESIAHVLKRSGRALITTPNYRGRRPVWVRMGSMSAAGVRGAWGDLYYHTAYRPEELAEMAERAGLRLIESGTLEKEVKYAAKLPAALLLLGRLINRLLRSQRFGAWNEAFFNKFSLRVYFFIQKIGLEPFALKAVHEGVRSYIVVEKP
ncbi:MAG: class I SAM-dependent methyltransferase [candidate division KSB1 bacterium]|nr:class I SAM-dependent methyltransferase [candidate division KSB1 bacterium]MDZ7345999.1 class I SAM-dependent methyltransferase [candidate division KSB1 bacterium]